MVKNYLLPSCHKLCCARPYQYVLPHPVANPHSRSVAPNRPPSSADFSRCSERDLFFLGWNCALATAWCTFCRLHLPKVFWTPHSFLIFRSANWALATVLCTFCRQLSSRPAPAETEFTRKKHRVSRTRVFSPLNSRVPELFLFSICCFHTRTALGSCLMMTWGHDDKTAPGHSSVTSKFP